MRLSLQSRPDNWLATQRFVEHAAGSLSKIVITWCVPHLDQADPVHGNQLRHRLSGGLAAIALLPRIRCPNRQPGRSTSDCERQGNMGNMGNMGNIDRAPNMKTLSKRYGVWPMTDTKNITVGIQSGPVDRNQSKATTMMTDGVRARPRTVHGRINTTKRHGWSK